MVSSSIRQRYNSLKDPPPQEKNTATTHLARGSSEEVANSQVQNESLTSSIIKEKDEDKTTTTLNPESDSNGFADDDPAVRDIPWTVRRIVSLNDDPTLPTLTFRYFALSFLFVIPGAFLSQMSRFRTTSAPYSNLFVQIASNYAGLGLAKILPAVFVRIPFTKRGFNLNPGPWSVKEHVLVTITAASGATSNIAYAPVSLAELYFKTKIHPAIAITFMWAVVWIGFAYAAIGRQFLLYDPEFPWFSALSQTALFETQKKQNLNSTSSSRKQMTLFFSVLTFITLWQFLPEFAFPFLQSMAFLCWVAPHNSVANFIGSGAGGMGFMNLSFDWSAISNTYNLFLTPWWTQVIVFVAFIINCWILIPAAKWGNLGSYKHGLMVNRLLTRNGTEYPVTKLLGSDMSFNQTVYEENGSIYAGTQFWWGMFFDYASYTSAISWSLFFGFSKIKSTFAKMKARWAAKGSKSINFQYTDQLNVLQRAYPEVPWWWYATLFAVAFTTIMGSVTTGHLFIPTLAVFVSLVTGAIMVIPLGWLYAQSNFQLAIGTVNELLYGLIVNAVKGHKNPTGATVYSSIAGDAWYRAQIMLQDQKMGHYMHIPPRAVFFSQLFGSFIGVPINYAVVRWVINTKRDFLNGTLEDPNHQWTGQTLTQMLTTSVQYVLIGPRRLFALAPFTPLPYGFLVGILAPLLIYCLHCHFPKAKLQLFNSTILFSCLSHFYGNLSTGPLSAFLGGFVVMYWFHRYKYALWSRYNYILAAAFDAGFNFNMLLIFLAFGAGAVVKMPEWWGNDGRSVERCFALEREQI